MYQIDDISEYEMRIMIIVEMYRQWHLPDDGNRPDKPWRPTWSNYA